MENLYNKSYFSAYTDDPKRKEMYWQEFERTTRITKLSGGKVLDVGCGLGDFLGLFPKSWKKYGVEVSEYAREIAIQKGINFKVPAKKNFFDLIVCTDVLEHVLDLNDSIKKILTVLKKGGINKHSIFRD